MPLENYSFIDSLYHTMMNVVAFGGIQEPRPLTDLAKVVTLMAKSIAFFSTISAAYFALQTAVLQRVDKITENRIKEARKRPINIFISYRREDSSGYTGRIYDRLSSFFGPSFVFLDIDTIAPGEDFVSVIRESIISCDLMVVVIGRNWTGNDGNRNKIFKKDDFVRIEVAEAITNQLKIIPVLVNNSNMPSASDIPTELMNLLNQHAIEISNQRWNHDIQLLIDAVDRYRQMT